MDLGMFEPSYLLRTTRLPSIPLGFKELGARDSKLRGQRGNFGRGD
jgi:hypothetical protein